MCTNIRANAIRIRAGLPDLPAVVRGHQRRVRRWLAGDKSEALRKTGAVIRWDPNLCTYGGHRCQVHCGHRSTRTWEAVRGYRPSWRHVLCARACWRQWHWLFGWYQWRPTLQATLPRRALWRRATQGHRAEQRGWHAHVLLAQRAPRWLHAVCPWHCTHMTSQMVHFLHHGSLSPACGRCPAVISLPMAERVSLPDMPPI